MQAGKGQIIVDFIRVSHAMLHSKHVNRLGYKIIALFHSINIDTTPVSCGRRQKGLTTLNPNVISANLKRCMMLKSVPVIALIVEKIMQLDVSKVIGHLMMSSKLIITSLWNLELTLLLNKGI